jgi:hypothetical protein
MEQRHDFPPHQVFLGHRLGDAPQELGHAQRGIVQGAALD